MIGIVIATILKDDKYLNQLIKLIAKCENQYKCIIINQNDNKILKNFGINIQVKNVNFKNNSNAKNIGYDYFKKDKEVDHIWFLDDDCYLDISSFNEIHNQIYSNKKILNYTFFLIQIKNYKNKIVGVRIFELGFLNFLFLFRVGGPSVIIRKDKIRYQFKNILGPGTKLRSSEDIDFHLSNFDLKVKLLKNVYITHPNESFNYYKFIRYSYGQGRMFQDLSLLKKIIFINISFYRPILAFCMYSLINHKNKNLYLKRIIAFYRGFKHY